MSSYSLFIVEPLHNLYLEIPELLKEYTVGYLSSDRLRTGEAQKRRREFVKVTARILRR